MKNMGHFSLLQGHIWIQDIFFMTFFGITVSKDEVKYFLVGVFFDRNGFGNRISTSMCNHSNF